MYKIILNLIVGLVFATYAAAEAKLVASPTLKNSRQQRIIVLEFGLLDELNLLGIKPIGVATSGAIHEGADPQYLAGAIKVASNVGARDAPNLEAITRLKPTLIIADKDFNQAIQKQLQAIAPTVFLPGIFGMPSQQIDNLRQLASLTHSEAKLELIIESYQRSYQKAANASIHGGKRTILIGFATPGGTFNALAANAISSKILATLGKSNLITQSTSSQLYELSIEGLLAKNPDQIVILLVNNDKKNFKQLTKNPLWQQLTAVKNHRVYFADRNIWGKSHGIQALQIMYSEAEISGLLANQPASSISN